MEIAVVLLYSPLHVVRSGNHLHVLPSLRPGIAHGGTSPLSVSPAFEIAGDIAGYLADGTGTVIYVMPSTPARSNG